MEIIIFIIVIISFGAGFLAGVLFTQQDEDGNFNQS